MSAQVHPLEGRPADQRWIYDLVLKTFHDEFCEYDGMEDDQPVCAAGCREFAETVSGLTSAEAAS